MRIFMGLICNAKLALTNIELELKTWHQVFSGQNFLKIVSSCCYWKNMFNKVSLIIQAFGYQRVGDLFFPEEMQMFANVLSLQMDIW